MTKDEALKLALEALTNAYWPTESNLMPAHNIKECAEAITAIKEALAQPEQEPAGEIVDAIEGAFKCSFTKMLPVGTKLYTTPTQRKPLTDEEIRLQWSEFWETECHPWAIDFAKAIEAKLRSKNSG